MKQTGEEEIKIPVPNLTPKEAYVLSNWLFALAHEIDHYYGDEIRSHMHRLDDEREQC